MFKSHLGPVVGLDLLEVLGEGGLLLRGQGLPAQLEVGERDLGTGGGGGRGGGTAALGGAQDRTGDVAEHSEVWRVTDEGETVSDWNRGRNEL